MKMLSNSQWAELNKVARREATVMDNMNTLGALYCRYLIEMRTTARGKQVLRLTPLGRQMYKSQVRLVLTPDFSTSRGVVRDARETA